MAALRARRRARKRPAAGRSSGADAPGQNGALLSRLWLRHEVPARAAPPRPAPARSPVLRLSDMIGKIPSLSAPPDPPCSKHVRPGPGGAWSRVTENQSGHTSPAPNPSRDRPPERPWCRQRGLQHRKPSPARPGQRPWSVLTEQKCPEAFPSEGKAGCRV